LQNQREACQTWRENHQDYWRQRRLKRSLSEATRDGPKNMASQDVNMDTLAGHANQQCFLDISKEYMIFPLPIGQGHVDGMSVNMDGLRVKFSSITAYCRRSGIQQFRPVKKPAGARCGRTSAESPSPWDEPG